MGDPFVCEGDELRITENPLVLGEGDIVRNSIIHIDDNRWQAFSREAIHLNPGAIFSGNRVIAYVPISDPFSCISIPEPIGVECDWDRIEQK